MKIQTLPLERFADFVDEDRGDAGRRRLAARSLDLHVRLEHEQQRPARQLSAAEHPRRRRRGALKGGQHVELPEHTTLTNLHLTVLNKAGIELKSFGDSTGAIAGV